MSSSLQQPAAAKVPKLTRTELDALIRKREAANEARKLMDRESAAFAKTVGEYDRQLEAILEAETEGEKEQQLTLKSFILSFIWVKPAPMAVAFKALSKLTPEAKATITAECGDKKKLDIQWRDAPPPAAKAAA